MTIETIKLILDIAQFLILLAGAVWAYFRVWKEGIYRPKIQFDMTCNFLDRIDDEVPTEVLIKINNKGLAVHKFYSINLRIRGVLGNQKLEFWEGNEPRLYFPEKLLDAQVIHTAKYSHVFVEPGVEQILTYVTKLPVSITLISVRAEFQYDKEKNHSIEQVYNLPKGRKD